MNVILPEEPEKNPKRLAIYIILIVICVLAVGVAVYQFFVDEKLGLVIGITSSDAETEEYEKLKVEFENVFANGFNQDGETNNINKIDENKGLVYTNYEKAENSLNNYDINVHIPYINIDNDTIKKYNEEISNVFEAKALSSLQTQNKNIIYTVEYQATITDNILSLIIRSNLKEGNNAQRVILQTYNYDVANNKEINLSEVMQLRKIDEKKAQSKIYTEIGKKQKQVEELANLGYNIFSRDTTSDIYKIENTTEFFIYNDLLYLIYAYGNQSNTSEMDLVIF